MKLRAKKMGRNEDSLVSIKPGTYMKLLANRMLRVQHASHGLCLNQSNDGHYDIVLVGDELILMKRNQKNTKEKENGNEQ